MTQQEFLQDLDAFLQEWQNDEPTVWVHTSGSTGTPKPMQVEKERMMASARLTCSFLGLKEGDSALLCMPLQYIAGKMVVVRSLVAGLRLLLVAPCGHPLKELEEKYLEYIQNRTNEKIKLWKYVQAYWLENIDYARKIINVLFETRSGDLYTSMLLEDGMFEEKIWFPAAVFSEMLWNSQKPSNEILRNIALREDVFFA